MWRALVVMFGLFLLCCPVIAQESLAGKGISRSPIMQEILDIIWKAAIPVALAYILNKHRKKGLWENIKHALELGVTDSFENFVRPLKRDTDGEHVDGKLKDGERDDARIWAKNKAEEVLTGRARRLFLGLADREVNSMIEGIVSKRKTKRR